MNTSATTNDASGLANGARRAAKDARHAADSVKRTASAELGNLIADVEDLIHKVGDVADVDVAQLRKRLQEKVATAKETLANGSRQITDTARHAAAATNEYVQESPWQAVGVAALVGAAFGYLLSRR